MEAPKKIYLFENPISGYPDDRWLSSCSCEDDIEYTRTDVFIEKACEWIKSMWSETDDRFKEDFTGMLINDFKKNI